MDRRRMLQVFWVSLNGALDPHDELKLGVVLWLAVMVVGSGILFPVAEMSRVEASGISQSGSPSSAVVATVNERQLVFHPVSPTSSYTIQDTGYIPQSLRVWANGLLLAPSDDYTVSGTGITTVQAWTAGDIVQVSYRY